MLRWLVCVVFAGLCWSSSALAMNKTDKGMLTLSAPGNWVSGSTVQCSWDWGNLDGNVELSLWKGGRLVATLASCPLGENGKGSASIAVPAKLTPGAYEVRLKSAKHPELISKMAVNVAAPPAGKALPFDDGSHPQTPGRR